MSVMFASNIFDIKFLKRRERCIKGHPQNTAFTKTLKTLIERREEFLSTALVFSSTVMT